MTEAEAKALLDWRAGDYKDNPADELFRTEFGNYAQEAYDNYRRQFGEAVGLAPLSHMTPEQAAGILNWRQSGYTKALGPEEFAGLDRVAYGGGTIPNTAGYGGVIWGDAARANADYERSKAVSAEYRRQYEAGLRALPSSSQNYQTQIVQPYQNQYGLGGFNPTTVNDAYYNLQMPYDPNQHQMF